MDPGCAMSSLNQRCTWCIMLGLSDEYFPSFLQIPDSLTEVKLLPAVQQQRALTLPTCRHGEQGLQASTFSRNWAVHRTMKALPHHCLLNKT